MTEKLKNRIDSECTKYSNPALFETGIDWYLKNLWHDVSELPDNPDTVVIEHSEYGTSVCLACTMSRVKGAVWCYLDDILPDNK